ncbi:DAK2 domain-containing protein [Actinopolyspora mortivallis]|uniref:DAK2 domain-containing protein n=1 Tax=Actinopolyspora mortivallis TaxID=33906 RepID=UPI00035EF66D
MLHALDGSAVRRWGEVSVLALTANRAALDRINVFPVADNDTGTNLVRTSRSAVLRLERNPAGDSGSALSVFAEGALHGAVGNSGLLLAQMLRGFALGARERPVVNGRCFRSALERGHELAAASVAEPVEGSMLTVLRAAVDACEDGTELPAAVHAATTAAITALRRTPEQRPELAAAGVVDAGGRGLLLVLDALHAVVRDGGRLVPEVPDPGDSVVPAAHGHDSAYSYEVMYLLSEVRATAAELRERLGRIGDCVSVADTGEGSGVGASADLWAVHVHCDDVGAAIETGVELGRPHGIRVTRFADQLAAANTANGAGRQVSREGASAGHVVLALARGERLGELFRSEGARVLTFGERELPDTREILEAVLETGREQVLLLPNEEGLLEPAENAAAAAVRAGIDAVVIPTSAPVQGLAALAVHDPERRTAEDTVAMAEAAAATRHGELVVADREALTWAGRCRAGDLLGMIDGEVVLIGDDRESAARELLDRMLAAGGELVTVLVPKGAPPSLPEGLAHHLRRTRPEVELSCYSCGESAGELMLGVE